MSLQLYINGYDAPKFVIRNAETNDFVASFVLDLQNIGGMQESYEYAGNISHLKADYSKSVKTRNPRIIFSMDYSSYTDMENSMKIDSIMNYWDQEDSNHNKIYRIILYPFSDNPYRSFEVNYTGETFDWSPMIGSSKRTGDRIIGWRWETKQLVPRNWMLINIDAQVIAFNNFQRRKAII